MAFKKIDTNARPRRQWALYGPAGSGKSTFATQLAAPQLWIDADHRAMEVVGLVAGDAFTISDDPLDHTDAERIAQLLRENITGSGVKTIVVDSLTSVITPLVVQAVMSNDKGENKNRVASFKPKAMAMRLLQDSLTATGADVLWIYHTREGLDGAAKKRESTSISTVELARLRRSLNMVLKIVEQNDKRGVMVEWARRGRSGFTLWDDSGRWVDMPERIEAECYDGLSTADQDAIERTNRDEPTTFAGPDDAIAWGFESGAFKDALHARNTYEKIKTDRRPASADAMWAMWIEEVKSRLAQIDSKQNFEQAAGEYYVITGQKPTQSVGADDLQPSFLPEEPPTWAQ